MAAAGIFDRLSLKVGQLLYGTHQLKGQEVFQILDQLNCLNYCLPIVENQTKAVLLINQICTSVDPDDERLVPKCAQLINKLITTQSVLVGGTTLNLAVRWCLMVAKNSSKAMAMNALLALEALIRDNAHNIPMLLDPILKQALAEIEQGTKSELEESQDLLLAAYKCLEASTRIPADVELSKCLVEHLEACHGVFTSCLCSNRAISGSVAANKIAETCLVGLDNLATIRTEPLQMELGLILGIVKSYMVLGIKGIDFLRPERLVPAMLGVPEKVHKSPEVAGGKMPRRRKCRSTKKKETRVNEEAHLGGRTDRYTPATISLDYSSDVETANSTGRGLTTSDSDFSDAEGGRKVNLAHSCSRVRQAALTLFDTTIKHEGKAAIFTYWSNFIPESSTCGKHHLVSCCLLDTSKRGRVYALNVLLHLITRTKIYLTSADSKDKTSSFTSFSVMLGLTLVELTSKLCLSLYDSSVSVLTHTLKCLAVLVQVTPYHRLAPGLITKIVRNVKPLVSYRDSEVQVTALVVMGCLLVSKPPLAETQQAVLRLQKEPKPPAEPEFCPAADDEFYAQFSSDEEDVQVSSCSTMSWLLHKCLRNLGVVFEPSDSNPLKVPPVKMESLQVLSAMSRNYFEPMMLLHLGHIGRALELSLGTDNDDVAFHAGRAIEFLGDAMGKIDEAEGSALCLHFWQAMLNGPLVALIQSQNHTLRAVGCDCLASIAPSIWEQLPRYRQVLGVTLLFGCSRDEQGAVRGAAARALSICVLHPSLRQDQGFVVDTAEAILYVLQDSNSNVRTKASWALSTLSDALVVIHDSEDEEGIPDTILLKLLETSIETLNNSNDKIKPNVARALGNLLHLLDEKILENERIQRAARQAIEALVKACGTPGSNAKVRWNACYALANPLRNPALYEAPAVVNWQPSVFSTLTELVVGFKNFKVRINAALALSAPTCREHYGPFFVPLWSSMLQALEHSQSVDDFSEYKHRDHLVEQICLCLGHLATLLTKEDLPQLDDRLGPALDMLRTQVRRVLDRLVPEKSSDLISATCALAVLESRSDITSAKEKRVIADLRTVFVTQ